MRTLLRLIAPVAALLVVALPGFAQVTFNATALTVPSGDPVTVTGATTVSGQTVFLGIYAPNGGADPTARVFTSANGTPSNPNLGSLGGDAVLSVFGNSAGQFAGHAQTATTFHAYFSNGGTMVDLGTLSGNAAQSSYATGINAGGIVVGGSVASSATTHAFRLDTTVGTSLATNGVDLGTLGGLGFFSTANAVNASGTIVGSSHYTNANTNSHAFRLDSGTLTANGVDLGTLGGTTSSAHAITNSGGIAGVSDIAGDAHTHVFYLSSGTLSAANDIGTLNGATGNVTFGGMNNSGHIVGSSAFDGTFDPNDASTSRAYYFNGSQMLDLTSLTSGLSNGIVLHDALAISDAGDILAFGYNADFSAGGYFVLSASAIPEPSTYAALAGAVALGVVLVRRRRHALANACQR
ncbi:PEP-CTERM sorting domain-containing protein [Oleiharenicola sp. Vm1]|uniref:PEP-CTERM sorting domain-containing protein n=1 Tax=Oleiharenicola sp. Vm1 TaxID=3398393 RepID=UPI0039F543AB